MIWLKNTDTITRTWIGREISPGERHSISKDTWDTYKEYSDVQSDISNGKLLAGDYKVMRSDLIVDVATTGFSNLSTEDKKFASKHFAVAKADRDTVHTLEEQIINGVCFHKLSVEARTSRRISAEAEVYGRVSDGLEQADIMNDVSSLLDIYVNFGVEGTLEGDVEGIFDYLEGRIGTTWENTGLPSKSYNINGMTVTQLETRLMDIFKNGNY